MTQPGPEAGFRVHPIGRVERGEQAVRLRVFDQYADALVGLEGFSHLVLLWWFDRNDTPEGRSILQVHPCRDPGNPLTGVFACRSPYRPNLIGLDVCRTLSVDGPVICVDKTQALDGSPIVDLKPYMPNLDEAEEARLPDWLRR